MDCWQKEFLRNLWMSSKPEIRTCMYSRHICIWMKKHRICTLILYHILHEVSEDLIQGRVSLKSALVAEGFTGGTRGATELNHWIASEKKELATVMERYGVE